MTRTQTKNRLRVVSNFFAEFDMFKAKPTLRLNEEPYVTNLCTGVFSFLLFSFFVYVFVNQVVGVASYSEIASVQTKSKLASSEPLLQNLLFAVNVHMLPIQKMMQHFYFDLEIQINRKVVGRIKMVPCTIEHFSRMEDQAQQSFRDSKLSRFLCPDNSSLISLKQTAMKKETYVRLALYVGICDPKEGGPCLPRKETEAFIQNYIDDENSMQIFVYLIEQAITPKDITPIRNELNIDCYFSFTLKKYVYARIFLGSVQVDTDAGLLPFEEMRTSKGGYLDHYTYTILKRSPDADLAQIIFEMSENIISVSRTVGKIDKAISYAGGLFSLIGLFLGFFLMSYNQYVYELSIGKAMFNLDKTGRKIRLSYMSFLMYVIYSVYDWVSTLFCIDMDWKLSSQIHVTREEANKQIDVSRLFRKIQNLENISHELLTTPQWDCISLMQPKSIQELQRNRMILEYYSKVITKGQAIVNLEDFLNPQEAMQAALDNNRKDPEINHSLETFKNLIVQNFNMEAPSFKELFARAEAECGALKKQALSFELDPFYHDIERQLAHSFSQLTEQDLDTIGIQIPLKIIFRLKDLQGRLGDPIVAPSIVSSSADSSVNSSSEPANPGNI